MKKAAFEGGFFFIGIYYDCITLRLALELKTKIERFKFLKMAARKDKREDLLKFVDKNAFDPILKGFAKKIV